MSVTKSFFRFYYTGESITPTRRYLSADDVTDARRQVTEIISRVPDGKYVPESLQVCANFTWHKVPREASAIIREMIATERIGLR